MPFEELDPVVLAADVPELGLRSGDIGTIVLVHRGGAGYEVEFCALNGDTIAVTTLVPGQLRPVSEDEVPHARRVGG